jgi:hypothetical protein
MIIIIMIIMVLFFLGVLCLKLSEKYEEIIK